MSEEGTGRTAVTRRSFLRTTGLAAGATALALGAQPVLKTLATNSTTGQSATQGEQSFLTGCQFMGCHVCQAKVIVRDGHVVAAVTNPDDPRGRRPCMKGRASLQRLYHAERLKYPMKRAGERGENKWERISWDEAITTIADKFMAYQAEFGPSSVAMTEGSGSGGYLHGTGAVSLLTRFRNLAGMTEISSCDDLAFAKGMNKVFGPATNVWAWPPFEPRNVILSKAYIAWGSNLTNAQPQDWHYVADAHENGTKIVSIDPTYTILSSKADLWVRPRPGSDTALVLSLIQFIISEDLHDKDFLLNHTVAPVLIRQDTKKYLRLSDLGVAPVEGPINPYTGQPIMIDPPAVWDVATGAATALGAAADPALTGSFTASGIAVKTAFDMLVAQVAEYTPEAASKITDVPVETIKELAQICVDGPVDQYNGYGAQSYLNGVQFGHALATLVGVTGNMSKPGAGVGSTTKMVSFNFLYLAPTFQFSPDIPRLALADVIKTGKWQGQDHPIKALYCSGTGMVSGTPETKRLIGEVLDKIEFIAASDIAFTDTVKQADIILPATHHYEREDIEIGQTSDSWFLFMEKAVEPLYECKPDGDMARLLAEKMGLGQFFTKTNDEMCEEALASPELTALGITFARLKAEKAIRWSPEYEVSAADGVFATDTGRMEFYVDNPTPRAYTGAEFDVDAERLPRFFPPKEAWPDSEIAKKYPLILQSERARNRFHSQGFQSSWLLEIDPEPNVRISTADAAARGIKKGDYVEVYNDRGNAVAKAVVTAALRPGVLVYPKGWQMHQFKAGSWAELSSAAFDPVGVNDSFFDTAVEVRLWNEEV